MGRKRPITIEQGEEIIRLYRGRVSRNSLAQKFNVSRPFITDFLRENNVPVRGAKEAGNQHFDKFPIRESAFDPPLGEEATYWIGFLMADGCISGRHIIVQLSECDAGHLEKFKSFMGAIKHKTSLVPAQDRIAGGREIHIKPAVRLAITSAKVVALLATFGVVPRKSLVAQVVGLEANRHFWRGYIDGNGWVGTKKKTGRNDISINLSLCGSKPIITQWNAFGRTLTDSQCNVVHGKGKEWQCLFSGRHAVRVIHHLYHDCTIALTRKLIAAETVLETYAFLLNPNIGYFWKSPLRSVSP